MLRGQQRLHLVVGAGPSGAVAPKQGVPHDRPHVARGRPRDRHRELRAIGTLSSRLQQPRVQRTICATDWRSFPGTGSVPTKNRSSRPAAHASLITRPSRLAGGTTSVQSGASGWTASQERRRGVLVSADPPGPIAPLSAMPTRPPSIAIVADALSRTPLWHPVIETIADTATAVATLHTIRR